MIDNITITKREVLSDNWYTLRKITYTYTKPDGSTHTQSREAYDRGNGAAIMLYNKDQKTDILTRQFSLPTYINDNESGLHADFEKWLEKLAPEKPHSQYAHNGFEDNADAHLKRQIMGRETVGAVTNGKLDLGTWEQIVDGEFDGKRRKRVLVKIIGE